MKKEKKVGWKRRGARNAVQGNHYTAFDKEVKGSTAVGRVDPRFVFVVSWYL